ncbi:hypothetical protein [Oxalicibacterium flavum]|nr:hypothetical protein [Oxalicibacterium flavum]
MRHFSAFLFMLCLALSWAWTDSVACQGPQQNAASVRGDFPAAQTALLRQGLPTADGTFALVAERPTAPWNEAFAGNHGCQASPGDSTLADTQSPDPHELDLLLYAPLVSAEVHNAPALASAHPPRMGPAFRSYRPPSLKA